MITVCEKCKNFRMKQSMDANNVYRPSGNLYMTHRHKGAGFCSDCGDGVQWMPNAVYKTYNSYEDFEKQIKMELNIRKLKEMAS